MGCILNEHFNIAHKVCVSLACSTEKKNYTHIFKRAVEKKYAQFKFAHAFFFQLS